MNSHKFYICKHCGNIIGVIHSSGVPVVCCGEPMTELKANTVEASHEKHIPVVTVEGSKVKVAVGSAAHPMTPEHYIQWIYLETAHGGQRKALTPDSAPEAVFTFEDDQPLAVYAYCNLHGLWAAKI